MKRIALILPYWGKLPNYFQFFLESIRRNPTIDVLLFTDNKSDFDYPSNVHKYDMSFEQFKEKLQAHFDFALTHLQSPYRLCDFKPAYGYCLQEYLGCYDFWGHCDCDLIFGDIRSILTDNILSRYDRILTRGHLTLYRNNCSTNMAFMDICGGGGARTSRLCSSRPLVVDGLGMSGVEPQDFGRRIARNGFMTKSCLMILM